MTDLSAEIYEKCRDCHLFVSPTDDLCSSNGDSCTCGWLPSASVRISTPFTEAQSEAYTQEYLNHTPLTYEHHQRGDDADIALDESHQATPSGRKANLLAWKTYGPLAMRERFTS